MKNNGDYKVIICNRVAKIKEKVFINWKYVPTKQNPADLGSRGCYMGKLEQNWWESFVWLRDPNCWPDQPMIESSEGSEIERKRVKEILSVIFLSETIYDKLLKKYPILKTLRILSWIRRFFTNCKKLQMGGPLKSSEREKQREFRIKEEQHRYSKCERFKLSKQ